MRALLGSILLFLPTVAMAESRLAFSLPGLVNFVVNILIIAAVVWLLLFIVEKWNPPEPFAKFLPAIIYTVAALILISFLLGLMPLPVTVFR